MFKRLKIYKLPVVICFLLLSKTDYAQYNRTYRHDSLKVVSLLAAADNCSKSAVSGCGKQLNDALKISTAYHSHYLSSLCYRSFANAERRNRSALLFKYDSLSVEYARLAQNDSLLVNTLLTQAEDFSLVNTPGKGKRFIDESFLLLKKNENKYLTMLAKYEQGFYYDKDLDFTKANAYYKQALSYAKELNNEYWVARLYRSISFMNALIYKKIDSSMSVFDALIYFKKNDNYEVANCLSVIGHVYRQIGNLPKASDYFNEAAVIYKTEKYPAQEADMYILMAEKFIERKELANGLYLISKAEKIFNLIGYEYGVNYADITYGRLFGTAGDWVKSNNYFNRADSILKIRPNKRLQMLLLSAKVTTNVYNGNAAAVNSIIDSAAKMTAAYFSVEVTDNTINHATSNGLLSKTEATDLKKYVRTGNFDTILWNKKPNLEGINPFTGDLPRFNSQYNELFNRQITEMETRYRTRIKDDSLKNVLNENKIARLKINRKNWLILFISLIAGAVAVILYLINRSRKKAIQQKQTIAFLKSEADHRVKNTFGNINRIIRDVKNKTSDTAGMQLLEQRITPLQKLYQFLGKTSYGMVELQPYFETIAESLEISYQQIPSAQVMINAPVSIESEKASALGLIVNELLTNAFKYAFTDNRPGTISVDFMKEDGGRFRLTVKDNGKGMPEHIGKIAGTGLLQVQALAQQLDAEFKMHNQNGSVFEFCFF